MAPARIRAYNFARELQRRGVKAEVLSFVDDFLAPEGVAYIPRNDWPAMDRYTLGKVLAMQEAIALNLHCPVVAQKADLNLFAMAMAGSLNGNKLILDYDDNDVEVFFASHRVADRIDDFHPRHVLQHFAEKADCCIASSHSLHEMLHAFNPQTHLVYTVVDTEIFDYGLRAKAVPIDGIDPGKVNLIWPGSVWNEEMTQDVLLIAEAFLSMPETVRAKAVLHFYGFGGGWPTAAAIIEDMMNTRGAMGQIKLNSAVAPDAMPGIMAHMDIGLICLQYNRYTRAKSPTKMFEYMAMGLAVCASSTGEPGRILEDGVTGVVAHDLRSYSEKLAHLIADAGFRQKIAAKGRELVNDRYTMRTAGDQLMAIFEPMMKAA
ncbi:MAG: glycosyltransferase family 4 protein [Alphaproteobacteria bacterium]|nr:glycosyltransferase family 4 protein [Alphaproteobacteria bacterium]